MRFLVFLLLSLPVAAEAPPSVIVKPLAVCVEGKCVISEDDYRTLQEWHAAKHRELAWASEMLDEARAEITALRAMLARFAAGCEARRT